MKYNKIPLLEEVVKSENIISGNKPFLLRNDGKVFECQKSIHPYIFLNKFDGDTKSYLDFIGTDYFDYSLREFMRCSNNKEMIECAQDFLNNSNLYSIAQIFQKVDTMSVNFNQEFLRGRVGGEYRNRGESLSLYFRISSINFNWCPIILDFVYDNDRVFTDITIEKDVSTFGNKGLFVYKLGDVLCNRLPLVEFENNCKNVIIESCNSTVNNLNDYRKQRDKYLKDCFGETYEEFVFRKMLER